MWRFTGGDYSLVTPAGETRGSWLFSSKKGRLLLLSVFLVFFLFVGAWMHPDTAAAISRLTGDDGSSAPTAGKSPDEDQDEEKDKNKPQEGGHPDHEAQLGSGEVERPEYFPAAHMKEEKEKFAYLTWLSSTPETDNEDFSSNEYFIACRVLIWQLLHDPKTKAAENFDVVVLAGPKVSEAHRERLRQDGAIVRVVEVPHTENDGWIVPEESRWGDVMGKLRAWEMVEYSRILMLDGDMLLQSPLDPIFNDPNATVMLTKSDRGHKDDEPDLPDDYLLCSFMEISRASHDWPPSDRSRFPGYFNAGFFMLKPSKKMFDYYMGLLDMPGRFSPEYPEQNLLNYAHRWEGAMPWREISGRWNTKFTSEDDLRGGVVSMHEKFWKLRSGGTELMRFVDSKRWQAEGYWLAQKEANAEAAAKAKAEAAEKPVKGSIRR
ncbi:hypothetical protein NLU13_1026 [Sarocladium strictum]|uniref:Nucleotide-diphospho-sugar transferase n=1 Tax=Sarocladium strictum TaxID=5046 RepID=A0AA39GQY1_SARSR|nr:hypothetical protein NLU13_1026 [Sarocladium strictum]